MAENNRHARANRPELPWGIRQITQTSPDFAFNASQHFHDIQDFVLNGLTPLINSTPLRTGPASPAQSSPFEDSGSVHQRNPAPNNVDSQGNFVIDIEAPNTGVAPVVANPNPLDGNGGTNDQGAALRNSPELQAMIAFAEKYVPFILILVLKLVFDHRIGIFVNFGLFVTFFHANAVLKREVAKQGKRCLRIVFSISINLVISILIIYSLLATKSLAYALVFIPPYAAPIGFCEVLWVVSVTDFVLRLITILVKLAFVALPTRLIAYQKKGKYYLFIERSSQLYRTLIPMQHWLYFFSESYSGPSKVFGVILSAAYLIFKAKGIIKKAQLWKKTLIKVIQSKTYGVTPSTTQIKEAGDACPICQDDYKSPAMLQCKHIFCEECVALWFDRERTCPICRAQIADDPSWRDGSTTLLHQIF